MSRRIFGKPVLRKEDERLLQGHGRYLDDVEVPGALHIAFLRSPVAHARLRGLDVTRARERTGVVAVFTHEDLGAQGEPLGLGRPHPDLIYPRTQPPLAKDEVNYVGQLVAMVVAENRYVTEDALELIELDLDPLPAVVDLEGAAEEGSALVHADTPSNVAGVSTQVVGDPDKAFREAEVVFQKTYVLDRSAAMPMEARGIVARTDVATGELTVWCVTQLPHPLRSGIAAALELPEDKIHVVVPDTGGGFGVKACFLYPEEVLVPWAAMQLGQPVKWVEDRLEHFIGSHHERKQIHEIEVAATSDGVVLALRDTFLLDGGAYTPYGIELPRIAASHLGGPYRIPNLWIQLKSVFTNTMMSTPYRGAGRPHACFVYERVLDHLARRLEIDRVEIRRRNFISRDEFPYRREGLITVDGYTVTLDSGDYETQLDMLKDAVRYDEFPEERARARAEGRYLGLGVACYVEATGMGPYEGAKVEVQATTGKVHVAAGVTSQGQAHETTFAQIVAEELGVDLDDVVVMTGDTRAFPWGVGTYASRAAVVAGSAMAIAAQKLRRKALRLAGNMLEIAPEDLEIGDGRVFVRGAPHVGLTLKQLALAAKPDRWPPAWGAFDPEIGDLARFAPPWPPSKPGEGPQLPPEDEPGLEATGYFSANNATWASGAHAAIVEVDIETGELQYVRYVVVHDCGALVNPMVVEGQVVGGVAQGIGGSFYEKMEYGADGQLRNASFMDFLIPYATEVPEVTVSHLETPSPLNPLGVKGVGEAGAIPVPAATASAVENALGDPGLEIDELPLDPESLFNLIRSSKLNPG